MLPEASTQALSGLPIQIHADEKHRVLASLPSCVSKCVRQTLHTENDDWSATTGNVIRAEYSSRFPQRWRTFTKMVRRFSSISQIENRQHQEAASGFDQNGFQVYNKTQPLRICRIPHHPNSYATAISKTSSHSHSQTNNSQTNQKYVSAIPQIRLRPGALRSSPPRGRPSLEPLRRYSQ